MGKIIKDNNTKIQVHAFSIFSKVEEGTKPYEVKIFSTVEKGTKPFEFKNLENIIKKESKQSVSSPTDNKKKLNKEENKPVEEKIDIDKIIKEEVEKARKIAIEEGYKKGFEEAREQFEKKYEAEKNDYLENLNNFMRESIKEIEKIHSIINTFDEEIPELVLRYVKEIVGTERKINDKILISLVKENLSKLNNFEEIIFLVNPKDESIVRENFPSYRIQSDVNVIQGAFKVKTNIGEIDFSIENMINQLENSINEKFKSS